MLWKHRCLYLQCLLHTTYRKSALQLSTLQQSKHCKLSMHQSPSQLYQPHSQCTMSSPEQHTDRWSNQCMLWKHRCPCLQCQRRSPCMRKYPHWSSASRHCIRCMSMSHRQQYLDTQHHTNSLRWPPLRQLRSCQSCPYMLCRTSMRSMSTCPHHNQCKAWQDSSPSQLYQPHSQCTMSSPDQHTDRWSSWRMLWKHRCQCLRCLLRIQNKSLLLLLYILLQRTVCRL